MPDPRVRDLIGWSLVGILAALVGYGILVAFRVMPG